MEYIDFIYSLAQKLGHGWVKLMSHNEWRFLCASRGVNTARDYMIHTRVHALTPEMFPAGVRRCDFDPMVTIDIADVRGGV